MLFPKEVCAILAKIGLALGILWTSGLGTSDAPAAAHSKVEVPAYAKWSRLAIKQTMLKYPHADIKDYLHIATDSKKVTNVEKFQLWLKEEEREFGVIVTVTYSTETGKFIRIDFQEIPVH
ncbi:hypothetical protein CSV71_11925 [Sporosarcina sp. P21c]|uniref:DUF3889 domain-containing protein n=1 Tax=unclassified Sporosarcina TaxID=2647733 RepID=UPI000C16619F|nr:MULTISPECIES: DUF3889 domain-containing protein [unclassified Sporosarcina]PIC68400.1 hypothetical protein CSV78_03340 [Sporosarcina sp. P16a]PIC88927.1 hypothetical protein CSV71_11925 [Sporosarcina sp. P21c]PIC92171.1 hypothetical protein CSV70_11535 [Sporosarcina sp. P25]